MGSAMLLAVLCLAPHGAVAMATSASHLAAEPAMVQPPIEAFAGQRDVELIGATVLRDLDGRLLLRGRLRASSQHRLAAARRLSVEGFSTDGSPAWRVLCAPRAEPVRQRSRVKRCAAFEVALPTDAEGSRIRIEYAPR